MLSIERSIAPFAKNTNSRPIKFEENNEGNADEGSELSRKC